VHPALLGGDYSKLCKLYTWLSFTLVTARSSLSLDDKDRSKTEKTRKLQTPGLLFDLLAKFFRRGAARSPYSRHHDFVQEKDYVIMEKRPTSEKEKEKNKKYTGQDSIGFQGNPSSCRTGDRTLHIPANQLFFLLHVH